MATEYQAEIARLEALLNSATKDVSADGLRTSFDLDQARKRLAELRALADPASALVRPRVLGCNLTGAW